MSMYRNGIIPDVQKLNKSTMCELQNYCTKHSIYECKPIC